MAQEGHSFSSKFSQSSFNFVHSPVLFFSSQFSFIFVNCHQFSHRTQVTGLFYQYIKYLGAVVAQLASARLSEREVPGLIVYNTVMAAPTE